MACDTFVKNQDRQTGNLVLMKIVKNLEPLCMTVLFADKLEKHPTRLDNLVCSRNWLIPKIFQTTLTLF